MASAASAFACWVLGPGELALLDVDAGDGDALERVPPELGVLPMLGAPPGVMGLATEGARGGVGGVVCEAALVNLDC